MSDVLVLCYHAVSADWPSDLAVTPARLRAQLAHLVDRGYAGTTFTAAVTDPPARRTLAITFDDGYRSVLDVAFPLLQRLGLPATVFVPTAWVGHDGPMRWPGIDAWPAGPWAHELCPLGWPDLRRLADAGWEIGAHSRTHPRLTGVDEAGLRAELLGAREDCEAGIGRACTSVAYPYGDVDARVVAAARESGYRAGAALSRRARPPRPLTWPRLGVTREDTPARFRRQASPLTRRLLATPAGLLAEAAYGQLIRR
jgi:peptidoglycan/xylan/chitin deacetylase (PgdA/CDA1 family)